MSTIIGLACGVSLAAWGSGAALAGLPTPPDLGGRWSGTPFALRADAQRCGPDGCRLTLDIVACGTDGRDWCGIEVGRDEKCGATALTMGVSREHDKDGREPITRVYKGKLTLAEGTQAYVVQAVLRQAENGWPERLDFVGDTGPELMLFRRSFPFHAELVRAGPATCRMEKPVS